MTSERHLVDERVEQVVVERRRREHVRALAEDDDADAVGLAAADEVADHVLGGVEPRGALADGAESRSPGGGVEHRAHRAREIEHHHDVDARSLAVSGRLAETGRAMASARERERERAQHAGQIAEASAQPARARGERRDRADAQARRALVLAERPAPEHHRHDQQQEEQPSDICQVTPSHSLADRERIGNGARRPPRA